MPLLINIFLGSVQMKDLSYHSYFHQLQIHKEQGTHCSREGFNIDYDV